MPGLCPKKKGMWDGANVSIISLVGNDGEDFFLQFQVGHFFLPHLDLSKACLNASNMT